MGWNRIIKTVKGHQYAYLQRSFRSGSGVCTESQYIGPVDGGGGAGAAPLSVSSPLAEATEPIPVITTKSTVPPRSRAPGLRLRFDTERAKVSGARLESDYHRAWEWAGRLWGAGRAVSGLGREAGTTFKPRSRDGSEAGRQAERKAEILHSVLG
jgi:hypothetical protein